MVCWHFNIIYNRFIPNTRCSNRKACLLSSFTVVSHSRPTWLSLTRCSRSTRAWRRAAPRACSSWWSPGPRSLSSSRVPPTPPPRTWLISSTATVVWRRERGRHCGPAKVRPCWVKSNIYIVGWYLFSSGNNLGNGQDEYMKCIVNGSRNLNDSSD